MEETKKKSQQKGQDQLTSASASMITTSASSSSAASPSPGERIIKPMEQIPSPRDERIVSTNVTSDMTIMGPPRKAIDKPGTSETSGAMTNMSPHGAYMTQEQSFYFGGYDNSISNWDEYSNYVSSNNLQVVPPTMYSDNPSLLFHSGYGFDTQMGYGQLSPMVSPLSPIMLDAQLYSPHQIPISPSYYPPPISPGMPHVTSALPVSQTELMAPGGSAQEGVGDNVLLGPGQGYLLNFGSFGGVEVSGNNNLGLLNIQGEIGSGDLLSNQSTPADIGRYFSPLTSATMYPQAFGILGSYDHSIAQMSHPPAPLHGFGVLSSPSRRMPQGGSFYGMNYGGGPISNWEANRRNQHTLDKGGRRERDQDLTSLPGDYHGIPADRHRGPRASKPKNRNSAEESSSSSIRNNGLPISGVHIDQYNKQDFAIDYENAKFFVIKSFSEDNVHKSIKYNVWASTPLGNKKLDSAYNEAKEVIGSCPVFLFFSVNASGQFCGVAEMVGPVDFENDANYWQQNRWNGQFPVKWHILKDVPNSQFRHILLENNDNKPVTHSRDSQEVKLRKGIEMLKIFKDYEADTSILDDFNFYDEREKSLLEKKTRDQASTLKNSMVAAADDSISHLSNTIAGTLSFKDVPKTEPSNG